MGRGARAIALRGTGPQRGTAGTPPRSASRLVGGGGLGLETVKGLRRTDSVGSGFVTGLAIVLLAMLLDRPLQAWTRRFTPVEGGP